MIGEGDRYHAKAFYREEPRLPTGKAKVRDTGKWDTGHGVWTSSNISFRNLKGIARACKALNDPQPRVPCPAQAID